MSTSPASALSTVQENVSRSGSWPRVVGILKAQNRRTPYYQIGWKAQWAMGASYVLLAATLQVMYLMAGSEALARFGRTWFG